MRSLLSTPPNSAAGRNRGARNVEDLRVLARLDREARVSYRASHGMAIVRSAQDLTALTGRRGLPQRTYVVLQVPGVPADLSQELQVKLNAYLKECGCSLGAKCAMLALGASFVLYTLQPPSPAGWVGAVVRTVLAMLMAGGLGKMLGIGWARIRIKRIAQQMARCADQAFV